MLYKEVPCKKCGGQGFISYSNENSAWSVPCDECKDGLVIEPVTNGDLIRRCTNKQLAIVYQNLTSCAVYSSAPNRQLLYLPAELERWLDKETDDLDVETIFDFINKKEFEHPWIKLNS